MTKGAQLEKCAKEQAAIDRHQGEKVAAAIMRVMWRLQEQGISNEALSGGCLQAAICYRLQDHSFADASAWLAELSEAFLLQALTQGPPKGNA